MTDEPIEQPPRTLGTVPRIAAIIAVGFVVAAVIVIVALATVTALYMDAEWH
jgi:hypothetical protein